MKGKRGNVAQCGSRITSTNYHRKNMLTKNVSRERQIEKKTEERRVTELKRASKRKKKEKK